MATRSRAHISWRAKLLNLGSQTGLRHCRMRTEFTRFNAFWGPLGFRKQLGSKNKAVYFTMTIILFLVDTSASMNQRTYLGTSMIDIAKSSVENFMKVNKHTCAIWHWILLKYIAVTLTINNAILNGIIILFRSEGAIRTVAGIDTCFWLWRTLRKTSR